MLAILSGTFTFGSNTLILLNRLAIRNFYRETFLLRPSFTIVSGDIQTLPLLDCPACLELKVSPHRIALSGGNVKTVLLQLLGGAVLTTDWLTDLQRN